MASHLLATAVADHAPPPALCLCDDATFWPWLTWPDVARAAAGPAVVLVPVAGFAERPGLPLDAEEGVLLRVVRAAAPKVGGGSRLLVVPPLRFVAGADETGAFAVDVPLAHAFIAEVCRSIAASGFRRVVLCNASTWNEDLCDVAARDLRIESGLQMFCVHLSALGLDFCDETPDARARLLGLLEDGDAADLAALGGHLAALLDEIAGRPALRDGGRLAALQPPDL